MICPKPLSIYIRGAIYELESKLLKRGVNIRDYMGTAIGEGDARSSDYHISYAVPTIRGTILGVPIIRTIANYKILVYIIYLCLQELRTTTLNPKPFHPKESDLYTLQAARLQAWL